MTHLVGTDSDNGLVVVCDANTKESCHGIQRLTRIHTNNKNVEPQMMRKEALRHALRFVADGGQPSPFTIGAAAIDMITSLAEQGITSRTQQQQTEGGVELSVRVYSTVGKRPVTALLNDWQIEQLRNGYRKYYALEVANPNSTALEYRKAKRQVARPRAPTDVSIGCCIQLEAAANADRLIATVSGLLCHKGIVCRFRAKLFLINWNV
jgi:hypothetical protein